MWWAQQSPASKTDFGNCPIGPLEATRVPVSRAAKMLNVSKRNRPLEYFSVDSDPYAERRF